MGFLEKNAAFVKLQEGDHLDADRAQLTRLNAKSKVLAQKFFDRDKERKEILYALLDVASENEIIVNRSGKRIVTNNKGKELVIEKKKSKKSKKNKKR